MKATIYSWFSYVTIPTYITLMRIALIPFIIQSIIKQEWMAAAILFVIASVTDLLDGALARFLNQVSLLGSLLDPLADKLLLISSFGCFALFHPYFNIPLWFVFVIIVNELFLVAFALYWGVYRKSISIKPTRLGRLVNFGQLLVIGWLILSTLVIRDSEIPWATNVSNEHIILTYVLLALVLFSRACVFLDYCYRAFSKDPL